MKLSQPPEGVNSHCLLHNHRSLLILSYPPTFILKVCRDWGFFFKSVSRHLTTCEVKDELWWGWEVGGVQG